MDDEILTKHQRNKKVTLMQTNHAAETIIVINRSQTVSEIAWQRYVFYQVPF